MTRRYLTPKQRRDMLAAQHGLCAKCCQPIDLHGCIAEHTFPVALGNASKPDCLLCQPCADRKTNGGPATSYGSDSHAIAKVRRLRGETGQGAKRKIAAPANPWPPKGARKIPSRPMREARRG